MKKENYYSTFFLFFGLTMLVFSVSCGSRNAIGADSREYRQLVERVNERDFEIVNEWANPLRASRIHLVGNPNYIRFEGDSVEVFLPFFGVRHSGGGYGSEGGIVYEGPVQNLRIEEMPGRGRVMMSFSGNQKSENLDFNITFFPGGKTNASVNSSQRDRMGYEGRIINKESPD